MNDHECLDNPQDCILDPVFGHCTLVPIIPDTITEVLLFQRWLFLTGSYDDDCDPGHSVVADNATDVGRAIHVIMNA